jgi:hypothetical protein
VISSGVGPEERTGELWKFPECTLKEKSAFERQRGHSYVEVVCT